MEEQTIKICRELQDMRTSQTWRINLDDIPEQNPYATQRRHNKQNTQQI